MDMRRSSLILIATVPVLVGLVGNVATGSVQLPERSTPWIWLATAVLAVAAVAIDVSNTPRIQTHQRALDEEGLDNAACEIAQAVEIQWRREERQRRIHDPTAISIHWHSASDVLIDHWINIRQERNSENQVPIPLNGRLEYIAGIYRRIPSGRLVVLGGAGSGKTVLAARLALDLLSSRRQTFRSCPNHRRPGLMVSSSCGHNGSITPHRPFAFRRSSFS